MTRAAIAISALASFAVATVVTGSVLTRASATDGAQPSTSCTLTTACIEGDNTSTGPGVKGTSAKGHGVIGTTKSKGSTGSNSHAGVFGQDLQNNIGSFLNSGVEGTSNYGFGVFGQALNGIGVRGEGFNGVVGEGA